MFEDTGKDFSAVRIAPKADIPYADIGIIFEENGLDKETAQGYKNKVSITVEELFSQLSNLNSEQMKKKVVMNLDLLYDFENGEFRYIGDVIELASGDFLLVCDKYYEYTDRYRYGNE